MYERVYQQFKQFKHIRFVYFILYTNFILQQSKVYNGKEIVLGRQCYEVCSNIEKLWLYIVEENPIWALRHFFFTDI